MNFTEKQIKEKAKLKMMTIAKKMEQLKPQTIGGIALRLLCDCVPTIEEAIKIIEEAEKIEREGKI